jgi:hypothetical protein
METTKTLFKETHHFKYSPPDVYLRTWVVVSAFAFAFALFVAGGVAATWKFQQFTCGRKADKMALDHDWGYWTGCRVEVNGRYVNIDDYRVTDEVE